MSSHMSVKDPLITLKQAIKSKSSITYFNNNQPTLTLHSATHLSLGSITFPKSTPTRYTKPGVSNAPSSNDFYTLEAVYLAWLLRDMAGAEYMKQVRENGLTVGFVSVTERKSVVEWLEGKGGDIDRIIPLPTESTTPPGTPPHAGMTVTATSTTPKRSTHTHVPDSISPSKRRYVTDAQDVDIVKRIKASEVELRDRNTVLRGIKPNNFSALLATYAEQLKKSKDTKPGATPAPPVPAGPPMQARKAKNMFPIIMISSSPTALITMYNVKRFLQESVFETSSSARERAASAGNPRAEDVLHIDRRRAPPTASGTGSSQGPPSSGGAAVQRYFVVDSTDALQKFGADAWERVVCVMTTGQAWQFRPYKWSDPRTLFHHVKGIYVTWSNDPPNPKIRDWNVTELKIDPHRRHIDKSVVAHFWKLIDDWTIANKPWLMRQ